MKTLGGFLFVRRGASLDYCFEQSIISMCQNCNEVSVVGIETGDGTIEALKELKKEYKNLSLFVLNDADWEREQGSHKLSYFQNRAASYLKTDYVYYQQADECATDESWKYIREAMEEDGQAYIVKRINLWQTPNLMLNVPQHRKPCSSEVCRLAKRGHFTYSDGENFMAENCYMDYVDKIVILHYGFVRKKEVHVEKIIQMQRDIFLTTPDAKLEGMKDFDGSKWFGPEDLKPITDAHPKIMQEWVKNRP